MSTLRLRLADLQNGILEVLAWTLAWSKETVQEFTNTSKYNDKDQSKVQRIGNWLVMSLEYGLQGEFQFRVHSNFFQQNMIIYIYNI